MKRALTYGGLLVVVAGSLLLIVNPKLQEKTFTICSDRNHDYEQSLSLIRGQRISEAKHYPPVDCGFGINTPYTISVKYVQRIR